MGVLLLDTNGKQGRAKALSAAGNLHQRSEMSEASNWENTSLKTAIKKIQAEARLEEARWWIKHLESHGDEILESDRERIATLEAEAAISTKGTA